MGPRSVSRIARRLARVALVPSLLVAAQARAGTPAEGLGVANGARCGVRFSALSYDDPGADDAEFVVLRVDRHAPLPAADGAAPAACAPDPTSGVDASVPGADGLTLGDCGLTALELVNGGSGACDVYRSIPLASVPVPADGVVTLCATDANFGAPCDVTAALRNGWLQNGPADGLRFVPGAGMPVELAYEGSPSCFTDRALSLKEEAGQLAGAAAGTDDVNVICDGVAVLVGQRSPALRDGAACPPEAPGAAGSGDAVPPEAGTDGGAGQAWVPERAPAVSGPTPFGSLHLDASVVPLDHAGSTPPRPPSCGVSAGSRPTPLALVAVGLGGLAVGRKRRRPG